MAKTSFCVPSCSISDNKSTLKNRRAARVTLKSKIISS